MAQAPDGAELLGRAWDFAGDLAQMDRAALEDAYEQPGRVPQPCDTLTRPQLRNPLEPGMIQLVDRYRSPPCKVVDVIQDNFTRSDRVGQPFVVKVSGR